MSPNKVVKQQLLQTYVSEVWGSNLGCNKDHLDKFLAFVHQPSRECSDSTGLVRTESGWQQKQ